MSNEFGAQVCAECGARVKPGTDRCELCGSELVIVEDGAPRGMDSEEAAPDAPAICVACGRDNRPDAVFCDQSATPLAQSSARADRPAQRPERTPVRPEQKPERHTKPAMTPAVESPPKARVGLLLAAGVVVVAILYGITVMIKSAPTTSEPEPATQQADADLDLYFPEDDSLAELSRSIRAATEDAADPDREIALRQELVELYAGNGRLDLAGREQGRIGELQNTATAWTLAGNLYFDWMEQQSGSERVKAARRAAAAYLKSLELAPNDLDVRTDLGVAFLNDPASPMAALRETNAVLEADSNHVQANFNKGVMLAQIGRNDQAAIHFERVTALTEPGSPAYDRATAILEKIQSTPG